MKKLSETANQIVGTGDVSDPEAIKVDIQVRSGGKIVPPPWFMPLVDSREIGPSKRKTTGSDNGLGDES